MIVPIFLPASFPVQHVKSSGVEWGWITVMSSPDCLVTGERCLNVCFGVSHVETVQLPSLLLRRILCTNFNLFFYNTWVNMLCHSRFLDWILFYVGCVWLWISSMGRWQRWEKPLDSVFNLVFVYDDKLSPGSFPHGSELQLQPLQQYFFILFFFLLVSSLEFRSFFGSEVVFFLPC